MTESEARQQFRRGLVGSWASYRGGGHDMHVGMKLIFREDGTGTMEEWGFDHQQLNPEYVSTPDFRWSYVGDYAIEITHCGETRKVGYDFRAGKNEYDFGELRVFEIGRSWDDHGEIGFWLSPFSLVYQGPGPEAANLLRRLWKQFKAGVTNRCSEQADACRWGRQVTLRSVLNED
jgi:hypothetical protein